MVATREVKKRTRFPNVRRAGAWIRLDPVGAYLVFVGVGYLGIGFSWALFPSHSRQMGIAWAPFITQNIVAILWALGGSMALFTGLIAKAHRKWGFVGLQGTALFLTLVFVMSAVLGVVPFGPEGRPESIITAISYATFWASAWTVAQIPVVPERG